MGNKVFVGGLSWDATDDDLKELFERWNGRLTGSSFGPQTGRSLMLGFVTFSSDDEAKAAIEKFQDFEYMGLNLTVNEARSREDRGGGGGGGHRRRRRQYTRRRRRPAAAEVWWRRRPAGSAVVVVAEVSRERQLVNSHPRAGAACLEPVFDPPAGCPSKREYFQQLRFRPGRFFVGCPSASSAA